ncbi:adhesion G protein-coupled receptor L3 [Daphnia magna]|uniref:adhesion G protein-coupled receptor L3 n=1 Tax=Daphnia magna TaxID=35525 RepID=UPI001E1BBE7C|nr:adhesion G protein-coupled receptor L3 [Daphnia magna]
MNTVLTLLVVLYWTTTNCQVRASNCVTDCAWTAPSACNNSESYCPDGNDCLVVTKSINSSYGLELSASFNRQFQCRSLLAETDDSHPYEYENSWNCELHNPVNAFVTIPLLGNSTESLSIFYAEMWSCPIGDNAVIQCPSGRSKIGMEYGCQNVAQLLPNVFALVRFWCQFKTSDCQFDSSLIMSHVGQSNVTLALPKHYVFEYESVAIDSEAFACDRSFQSVFEHDSCYRLTPVNLEWKEARSYCLQLGGDLAHFTSSIDFASILRSLDNSIPSEITASSAIPTWFKFYTWDNEQRTPQHFRQYLDGFQCAVYEVQPGVGPNPHSRCKTGTKTKKVRGLCVLPPGLIEDNFNYEPISCPIKCGVSGYPSNVCWEGDADTKVYQDCPNGLTGNASWTCNLAGQWMTPTPDLSNCTNSVIEESISQANKEMENGGDPSQALGTLSSVLKQNELASGDIIQLDQTVRLAIDKQTQLLAANSDPNSKDSISKNFTSSVTDVNNVLLGNELAFWGLESNARSEAIDQVQKNMDDTLFLLASNLLEKIYKNNDYENIAVQVENKPKSDYNNETYVYVSGFKDQLILPAGFPYATNDPKTRLSFTTYPAFQNLLYGDTLAQLFEENRTNSDPIKQVVVSKVMGATLGEPNGHIHFVDGKVEILLSTLNLNLYEVDRTSARCAYWNVSTQDWSFDGCEVVETNDKSSTRCRCNHLTNFAVVMDINGVFRNKTVPALDYITIIGESISIACLTLALIIFYWVRTLRRDFRFMIHRNLCINLLIAEILLLAGIDATSNRDVCLSIGVFLHLFFLCAFSWMFIEGLYMYFLITKVFDGSGLKRWQYYAIGYGFPVLVVAITLAATNTQAYSNSTYCWLSYENGAIWAFAGPVAAILLMNLAFLTIALSVSFKSRRNFDEKKEKKHNFRWIFGTISLTFILGITWFFGFLFFGQSSMIFAYIFTVLNSLQGLFIFITFCVLNKKVRKDLQRQFVTSQRLQRVALYFNVTLSDLHTIPSQNKTGTYDVRQRNTVTATVSLESSPFSHRLS